MTHLNCRLTLLAGLFVLGPALARADFINFAGLTTAANPEAPIPNGYDRFTWNNFSVLNSKTDANVLPSGYGRADVDSHSPNVAFNLYGQPASMTRNSPFSFYGAFFTAAWRDALNIDVSGYRDGVLLYDKKFQVNSTAPTFESFDFVGIDALDFSSSGGTVHGYVPGKPLSHPPLTQFAMDDFLFVRDRAPLAPSSFALDDGPFLAGDPSLNNSMPEPAGFLLFTVGALIAVVGARLRRRSEKDFLAA